MSNRSARATAISGRQDTGLGTATITIGCRAHGWSLRKSGTSGLRAIGVGTTTDIFSMKATGARPWVSMVGSTMASVTSAMVMTADAGTTGISSTTGHTTTWTN